MSSPTPARKGAGTIRGILFDKDGTLFDFAATWVPAYEAAAAAMARAVGRPGLAPRLLAVGGYDAERRVFVPESPLACAGNDEIIALWLAEAGVEELPGGTGFVLEILYEHAARGARPVTDLGALFGRLCDRGLSLGVATNDATEAAQAALEGAGVATLVDFVAGYDAACGSKPSPAVVHAFCRDARLAPAEVAVVGDSAADAAMARAAGAGLAIGVLTGTTPRGMLEASADRIIDSVADLESVLA
jgi:phosphoglycolate phosphatase